MKSRITLVLTLLLSITAFTQNGINYKALIKDANGNVLANHITDIHFIIYEGAALTNNVYQETHSTIATDVNGIVVVNIGQGSTSDNFGTINWGNDTHFLNVQIDIGSGSLIDMGTTQFMAVPYALQAENLSTAISINDLEDGKTDTSQSSVFLGNDAGLMDDDSNNGNVGIGTESLRDNTSGFVNVAIGSFSLLKNETGRNNTAIGHSAMFENVTGGYNVAIGASAMRDNISAFNNTAIGESALQSNTTGQFNTAVGRVALLSNNGSQNTAVGYGALQDNETASFNTAVGLQALFRNTTGQFNSALGHNALQKNTIGFSNNSFGLSSMLNNIDGNWNNAFGGASLISNISGSANCTFGDQAMNFNTTGSFNVAMGYFAMHGNVSGNNNVAVGHGTMTDLTSGENNIAIGAEAQVPNSTGSNQIRIGDINIASADIQVAWNVTSDKRWKESIRDLPYGLNMVNQLRPVDYIRKNNKEDTREIGFIAQDVENVLLQLGYIDQGLLSKDENGYISLRYNDIIPVLTKAIQEQQKTIESLNTRLSALEALVANNQNSENNSKFKTD